MKRAIQIDLNTNTYSLKQLVYRQPFLAYTRLCGLGVAGVLIALLLAYVRKRVGSMPRKLGSPQKGSWDYGVDYEAAYRELVKLLKSSDSSKGYAKCYAAIALIALRNGARVGEAIEAFAKFLQGDVTTKRLEDGRIALVTQVRVEKHRKEDYRLIVFPAEILEQSFDTCAQLVAKGKDAVRAYVNRWLREKLRINCHSLRYVFITHMLRRGVSPAIIASITKHRNLNMILKYVQEKVAEQELLQL